MKRLKTILHLILTVALLCPLAVAGIAAAETETETEIGEIPLTLDLANREIDTAKMKFVTPAISGMKIGDWALADDPETEGDHNGNRVIRTAGEHSMLSLSVTDQDAWSGKVAISMDLYLNSYPSEYVNLIKINASSSGSYSPFRLSAGGLLRHGSNNSKLVGIDTLALETWYNLRVEFDPTEKTDNLTLYVDGEHVGTITADIFSGQNMLRFDLCHQYKQGITSDYCVDNITVESEFWMTDESVMFGIGEKKSAEEVAKDQPGVGYVMEEFREYVKRFTYLEDDGKIGIPVALTSYSKTDTKTKGVVPILYVRGYVGDHGIAAEDDESIIRDFLNEGRAVVVCDYLGNPLAEGVDLDWSVQNLRINISKYIGKVGAYSSAYVVPAGYRLVRNVLFYSMDKQGYVGTVNNILDRYNDMSGAASSFQVKKGSMIPKGYEHADTIEGCVKPDGTPIDLDLRLDIIYPSKPKREAEVVMIASSSETRENVFASNADRPLDVGPLMRGCAVAVYDHAYVPMARNDHYGYFDNYSMMSSIGFAVHSTAVRCVRYYADTYGYSRNKYAVMGHSKAAQCGVLSNPHPERLKEWGEGNFAKYGNKSGRDTYGEPAFLTYADGTPIPSNVTVAYHSMGDGSKHYSSFLSPDNAPTMIACGKNDQYGAWNYWEAEQAAYEASGTEFFPVTMLDQGHTYPLKTDTVYNYDRWACFMDFLTYYLRGNERARVVYTTAVNGKLTDNTVAVRFLASVTAASAEAGITLYDETAKADVAGSLGSNACGNLWTFTPASALTAGHKYTLRVAGSVASALNGSTLGGDFTVNFGY